MAEPTTLNPEIDKKLDIFIPRVVAASTQIKESFFTNFDNKKIGPISKNTIIKFYDTIWCPNRKSWEGGWADDPDDDGGPTMVGVTLSALRTSFDKLFGKIEGAKDINALGWKTNRAIGCQVLFRMLSQTTIQDIFLYNFYCHADGGNCNLIATVDPWFSLVTVGAYWGTGGDYFIESGFSAVAKAYGYSGKRQEFGAFVAGLTDVEKIVQLSVLCFTARVQFMLNITKPGNKNEKYRTGWLNGQIFGDTKRDSKLQLLVRTMDFFKDLGTANQLSQVEIDHLTLLKAYYDKITFTLPT